MLLLKSKSACHVNLIQLVLYHKWGKVVNSGIPYRCELKNSPDYLPKDCVLLPSGLLE
jgi:hypothetical protein